MLVEGKAGGGKAIGLAGGGQRRFPRIRGAAVGRGQGGQTLRRLDQARGEISALQIAPDPVEVSGGAAQHVIIRR
jgi:hypothetical protein